MKTGWTFHVKKLHIERNNDKGISALKDNPSSANLFITREPKTNYNGEPQPLKVSQPTPYLPLAGVYLYYFNSEITLWNKPKNCFQTQSNINSLESGTIAMIYKYEQHYGAAAHGNSGLQHIVFSIQVIWHKNYLYIAC